MPALYVHVPFCQQRCWYCDFITYAGKTEFIPRYTQALTHELDFLGRHAASSERTLSSVYLGGGTPSLLTIGDLEQLFKAIRGSFLLPQGIEVSMEVNPGTLNGDYLRQLREIGVNRLSLGIQSFDDRNLRQLQRTHDAKTALKSIQMASEAGFESLSVDLIFGLPGQNLQAWSRDLEIALESPVQHLSLYSLILEEETGLAQAVRRGEISLPDEDMVADMYALARERLAGKGWKHYEISNWARESSFESVHNKSYWLQENWLGVGAAAHGLCCGWQTENVQSIQEYCERLETLHLEETEYPLSPANIVRKRVEEDDAMRTYMIFGLRLIQHGVSAQAFEERFGKSMSEVFGKEIRRLIQRRILEWVAESDGWHLRLSHAGVALGNQAFMEFVDA
jgi:oxygen-independent coproporphyrinogen-3 oxidase